MSSRTKAEERAWNAGYRYGLADAVVPRCEPVGAPEIAERLGVQANTVRIWKTRGLLPEPRWAVHSFPAWNWPDIEEWARRTGRLSVGAGDAG